MGGHSNDGVGRSNVGIAAVGIRLLVGAIGTARSGAAVGFSKDPNISNSPVAAPGRICSPVLELYVAGGHPAGTQLSIRRRIHMLKDAVRQERYEFVR